jgi:hypothetical protein
MNHGDSAKRIDSGRETYPADGRAVALSLESDKRPLNFEATDTLFDRWAARLAGLPQPLGVCARIPCGQNRWHRVLAPYPFFLPAQQPSMRGALGGPLEHTGQIAPVAACEQHVEQGIDDLAKRGVRPATTSWPRLRRQKIGKVLPR